MADQEQQQRDQQPQASQQERDALNRHYSGNRYQDRIEDIIREYTEMIERNQKALDNKDKITFDPEATKWFAERYIDLGKEIRSSTDSCMPVGLAARIAANNGLVTATEIDNMSPGKLANIRLVTTALEIPLGNALINRAMKNDVMTCAAGELGNIFGGFYDSDLNFTTFSFDPDKDLDADDLRSFYEELYHSDQVKTSGVNDEVKVGVYHRKDIALWEMGVEANAKVASALMIMEHSAAGHDEFRKHILESTRFDPDGSIFEAVNDAYEKHGLEGIRNNPSLLAPAFEAFFAQRGMADTYMQMTLVDIELFRVGNPEEYNKIMSGKKHITLEQFTETFGKIPGLNGNILQGRYQSLDDVRGLFPADSNFKKWLTGEFNFAADPPTPLTLQQNGPAPLATPAARS